MTKSTCPSLNITKVYQKQDTCEVRFAISYILIGRSSALIWRNQLQARVFAGLTHLQPITFLKVSITMSGPGTKPTQTKANLYLTGSFGSLLTSWHSRVCLRTSQCCYWSVRLVQHFNLHVTELTYTTSSLSH